MRECKCIYFTSVLSENSGLPNVKHNDSAAILCFGGSVFTEILAVAHCGKWCDMLCSYYSVECIFELFVQGFIMNCVADCKHFAMFKISIC